MLPLLGEGRCFTENGTHNPALWRAYTYPQAALNSNVGTRGLAVSWAAIKTHGLPPTESGPSVCSAERWGSGETVEPSWTLPGPAQQAASSFSA